MQSRWVLHQSGIEAMRYTNAFDVGPDACPFCGEDQRMLVSEKKVITPRGERFPRETRIGFCCLRCGTAANSDLAKDDEWRTIEDFLAAREAAE